jgi:hypothetical protein
MPACHLSESEHDLVSLEPGRATVSKADARRKNYGIGLNST